MRRKGNHIRRSQKLDWEMLKLNCDKMKFTETKLFIGNCSLSCRLTWIFSDQMFIFLLIVTVGDHFWAFRIFLSLPFILFLLLLKWDTHRDHWPSMIPKCKTYLESFKFSRLWIKNLSFSECRQLLVTRYRFLFVTDNMSIHIFCPKRKGRKTRDFYHIMSDQKISIISDLTFNEHETLTQRFVMFYP